MTEEWEIVEVPTHPIRNGRWVAIIVDVRDNKTGEIRSSESEDILMDYESQPATYGWEHGNFACDCNRQLIFERANNIEVEETTCGECGYSVRLKNKKTGAIYYDEFDAPMTA